MIQRSGILPLCLLALSLVVLGACSGSAGQVPSEPTLSSPDALATPVAPGTRDIPVSATGAATAGATVDAGNPVQAGDATPTSDPDSASLADRARRAVSEGDLEQGIALWQQVVAEASDEQRLEAVLELGRAYLLASEYDMAIAQASWAAAVDATPELRMQALGLLGTAQEAAGDWRGAAESLTQLVSMDERAAPYVWWHIAGAYKAIGDLPRQIAALESIDVSRLEPAFRAEVLSELASAYRGNEDPNSALQVYDQILGFATLPDYRALISHYKGETLREASHEQEAITAFYEVANGNPASFAAYLSLQELIALEESEVASTGVVSGTPALALTDLTRGQIHYYAQEYNLALEYLNYYLDEEPERDAAEAHYYLGLTLTKQGQYEDALIHYDQAIETAGNQELLANAWFAKAWTIGASGSDPSAFYYEFYVNHPDHSRAAEALWEAAQTSEEAGNWAQAANYYGALGRDYADDQRAPEAAFREGLAFYAVGDPYSASATWRVTLDATQDVSERARLVTWMGLAAKKAGQLEQADIYWQEAARTAPEAYYGLRGADLLQHAMPRLPSGLSLGVSDATLSAEEWQNLENWVRSWTPQTSVLDLESDYRFLEAQALQELGWPGEAAESLNRLQQVLRDSPLEILQLARHTLEWQAYPSTIWCAQRLVRLARDAGVSEPPLGLQRLAYPVLYQSLVTEYARHWDLDPLLMMAIVRQESLFNPLARSSAGALGLAQIMPETGEWIASQIGPEDYREELLLRPNLNLKYSAWYYELLLNLYDRDWVAALVAYNAGPGNLKSWTDGQAIEDHDLFVETLPSDQAQLYVQQIYQHYAWYRRLYRAGAG